MDRVKRARNERDSSSGKRIMKNPPATRASKKGATRDAILRAALHLIVTRGYHRTSTSQIARAAGVAEGTLYVHFKSKEQLALEIFKLCSESMSASMIEAVQEAHSTAERIRIMIARAFDWCEKHREEAIYAFLLRHSEIFPRHLTHMDVPGNPALLLQEVILQAQQAGEVDQQELNALEKVAGIPLAFIRERLEDGATGDLRDKVDIVTKMCCGALGISQQTMHPVYRTDRAVRAELEPIRR